MKRQNIAIVIPTIRDLDFLKEWKDEFKDCIGIIVEDHKNKEVKSPTNSFRETYHYTWKDIDQKLGKNSWIISRKNSGIRTFGFLKACELGAEYIITLDDDCYPEKNSHFLKNHLLNLSLAAPENWFPSYPHRDHPYMRGFPYGVRNKYEVVISHGLWTKHLDFNAPLHLNYLNIELPYSFKFIEFMPRNYFFPMCSMNLAFKAKVTPLMYFPLMGFNGQDEAWGYDRFEDIWCGLFAKKIIDHLGYAAVNGNPFVEHRKESNVFKNLQKEATGIEVNEWLYKNIMRVKLKSKDIKDSYKELAEKLELPNDRYFKMLKKAMKIWADLFKK